MTRYITIEREYGSGARYIANKLADVLTIECYGQKIFDRACEKLHVPASELRKYEESPSNSLFYSMMMMGKVSSDDKDKLMGSAKLFVAEQAAIHEFASMGPAIFLGHLANAALNDDDEVIRVFIKSNLEDRKKRIVEHYGVKKEDVASLIKKFDKQRANYYASNTNLKWRDLKNYDIIIDTSKIDLDCCVEILKTLYYKNR